MASKKVLQEAIKKLTVNSIALREKRKVCTNKKEVEEIDKQLSQNKSMILDYEYRLGTEV